MIMVTFHSRWGKSISGLITGQSETNSLTSLLLCRDFSIHRLLSSLILSCMLCMFPNLFRVVVFILFKEKVNRRNLLCSFSKLYIRLGFANTSVQHV